MSLKLLRVNLIEEMICQFKDDSILKSPFKVIFSMKRVQMQMVRPGMPMLLF